MNKKCYVSSIPNPHMHMAHFPPQLKHGILIGGGECSSSLRSNTFRLRELRISKGSMFHSHDSCIVEGKNDLM